MCYPSPAAKEGKMAKILTGKFPTHEHARNAFDDLINAGFEREKVYLDRETHHVKVITPLDTEREARELLGRHDPEQIFERPA
jgi:hypothetical protein